MQLALDPRSPSTIMSSSLDGSLKAWSTVKGSKGHVESFTGHEGPVNAVSFAAKEHFIGRTEDGSSSFCPIVLSGGDDGTVRIWDRRAHGNNKCVRVLEGHSGNVTAGEGHS